MIGTYQEFVDLKNREIVRIEHVGKGYYLHHGINILKLETLKALGLVPANDVLKNRYGLTVKK